MMNKTAALLLTFVMIIMLVSGCAQNPTAPAETEPVPAEQTTDAPIETKIAVVTAAIQPTLKPTAVPTPVPAEETAAVSDGHISIEEPEATEPVADVVDVPMELVPLTAAPAMFSIPMPSAPGTNVASNERAVIDYSNSTEGYIMIKYQGSTSTALKVIIQGPSGEKYIYTLKGSGDYEVYPLSDGNGTYNITVGEQVEGTKYATLNAASISVSLKDQFAPFIRPNQYVNYTTDSQTVKKAAELINGKSGLMDQIAAIYDYVVDNISYDTELAKNVKSGYLPNLDSVLKKGKGICFDYAAVMTAMLRSQGVPTKLVLGYTGKVYHAWISVYSKETGWVDSVIYFDGKTWKLMDPTFASSGGGSDDIMKYIGDGTNYKAKYLY